MANQVELEQLAEKNLLIAIVLGITISPLAYLYLGRMKWAAINFFTLNYLLLGFIAVPIHSYLLINNAQQELAKARRQRQQAQQQQPRQQQTRGSQQNQSPQQQRRNGQGRQQAKGQQPNRRQQE